MQDLNFKKVKKIVAGILIVAIFSISSFSILPQKAEAQWVVFDPSNLVQNIAKIVKDYGLDAVAWQVVNLVISRMAQSTVNWINSGFKGKPGFIENPEKFYANIGNQVAGQYIFKNPNLNFLCGPIRAKIRIALAGTYNRGQDRERWQCTLTKVGRNLDNFMADFENGGWENFFELTQRPQNNPIGAYLQAEGELFERIAQKTNLQKEDLLQGKGLLSFKRCTEYSEPTEDDNGNIAPVCIEEETSTPGSVISDQLNKQLGLGQDRLAVADEINEIVSALLNQLVGKIVGGIGKGLRSLIERDPADNNRSFTDQLGSTTASNIEDYFGGTQNTTILDQPAPDPFCRDQSENPDAPYYDIDPKICAYRPEPNPIWPDPESNTQQTETPFQP